MSEPFDVVVDPKKHLLQLTCGQCGDVTHLTFEQRESGQLVVTISDGIQLPAENEQPEHLLTPVKIET
jgi:hypothetical protein